MRRLAVVPVLVVAACGGASVGEWAGTVTDSAGVPVVQNPAEGGWTLLPAPRVEEELRIGAVEGEAAYQFGQIMAVDVDEAGRIYVLDQQAAAVRVFDAGGRHIRTVGRPGGGPGELSMMTMAVMAGGDEVVYVADVMRQRIAAFGADGAEVGSTPLLVQDGMPVRIVPSEEGRFALHVRSMMLPGMTEPVPPRDWILLRSPSGEAADTIMELESGTTFDFSGGMPRIRLFSPEPMWTLLDGGRVAYGRNDAFRIEIRAADGSLERVITRPTQRQPVSESDRRAFLSLMRRSVEQQGAMPPAAIDQFLSGVEFADHYPAYAIMMGGPAGTLWVQRIATAADIEGAGGTFDPNDVGSPDWDVFDSQGRLLGKVSMPPRFQPLRVVGNRFYGMLRDELDVQHVARVRIDGLE